MPLLLQGSMSRKKPARIQHCGTHAHPTLSLRRYRNCMLAEPGSISIATLHRDYIDLCRPIAFIANIVRRKSR